MDEVDLLRRVKSIGRGLMIGSMALALPVVIGPMLDSNVALREAIFSLLCVTFTVGSALRWLCEARLGGHVGAWLLPEHIAWARKSVGQPVVRVGLLLCLFGFAVLVWALLAQNLPEASIRNGPWFGVALMAVGAALVAWGAWRVR